MDKLTYSDLHGLTLEELDQLIAKLQDYKCRRETGQPHERIIYRYRKQKLSKLHLLVTFIGVGVVLAATVIVLMELFCTQQCEATMASLMMSSLTSN